MINGRYIDRGKLQISALTASGAAPVPDALIRLTDPADGTLLGELRTDSSGQTEAVELPAPPIEYSITETGQRPYATYNVTVRAAGFEKLHIGGVEVLPTSTALQVCRLKPATDGGFNVRNVMIDPHVLWGDYAPKTPEEAVKELPEASGLVVLPEPVIPEFIIVHLGNPDDASAQNVWVRFQDYIKNVASSEIYSTWNAEAIRANVLAILSFTLNRVYTEWYRGKGYEFTVTNSTAFDQAYRVDGTIFEDISLVVDEIFTTYITKPNIRQPLFTQYCDGRRTQCEGLSQWGSQALGQEGLDAVSILKRYYGSDIYLETAPKVEGVPLSYGGSALHSGSEGDAVRTIQSQLNAISAHYPAIPKLADDGYFGVATEEAVRVFQGIFHLPENGVVDFATWYQISNLFVAVSKLS